jgi:hypothetical protein
VFAEAILGHLGGDFILQDDWQAANKAGPPLTEDQHWQVAAVYGDARHAALDHYERVQRWKGHLACAVHCLLWAAASAWPAASWPSRGTRPSPRGPWPPGRSSSPTRSCTS